MPSLLHNQQMLTGIKGLDGSRCHNTTSGRQVSTAALTMPNIAIILTWKVSITCSIGNSSIAAQEICWAAFKTRYPSRLMLHELVQPILQVPVYLLNLLAKERLFGQLLVYSAPLLRRLFLHLGKM